MSRSAERTAMEHARAVVAEAWPGRPVEEARRTLQRAPGPQARYFSRRVDLFGVFDLMVLDDPDRLIQVTTASAANPNANARKRKRKIEAWIDEHTFPPSKEPALMVWAWVPRQYFAAWMWDWSSRSWTDRQVIRSPALARRRP